VDEQAAKRVMNYRIEVRCDVRADDAEQAQRIAQGLADEIGGEVTAIFDEDWEELAV
jgi:hypothetical protein